MRWIALTLVLTSLVTPARAQPVEDRARARASFSRGREALDAGRFDEAVGAFRASLEAWPRAATAWNLAVALRATGRKVESRATLRRIEAGELGRLEPSLAEALPRLQAELDEEIAVLTITARGPEDLQLRVDGELVREGPGQQEVELDPGTHRVTVTALEGTPIEREVELALGERAAIELVVRRALDERPGRLVLDSSDPSATLEVVGVRSGPPPLAVEVAPGTYTIVVVGGGGARSESTVTVPAGRRTRIRLDPPGASSCGPIDCEIIAVGLIVLGLGAAGLALGLSLYERPPEPNDGPFGLVIVRE